MKKRGEDMFKAWKKRWFQQRAWSLEYFKTHSSTNTQEVLGSIDMTTMRKLILPSDPDAKYEFHVQTDFRLYIFQVSFFSFSLIFLKNIVVLFYCQFFFSRFLFNFSLVF